MARPPCFNAVVPISVVLTPENGPRVVDANVIDNLATNPATITVNVGHGPTRVRKRICALVLTVHPEVVGGARAVLRPQRVRAARNWRSLRTPDLTRQPTANVETTRPQSTEERA
jgi:hypothetical protein